MIVISRELADPYPTPLNLIDVGVSRNYFGRQVDSFETDIDISCLDKVDGSEHPYHAVFIRAPVIEAVGAGVTVLASLDNGRIVAAQEGKLLATSFHPELTDDDRFHCYFLEQVG